MSGYSRVYGNPRTGNRRGDIPMVPMRRRRVGADEGAVDELAPGMTWKDRWFLLLIVILALAVTAALTLAIIAFLRTKGGGLEKAKICDGPDPAADEILIFNALGECFEPELCEDTPCAPLVPILIEGFQTALAANQSCPGLGGIVIFDNGTTGYDTTNGTITIPEEGAWNILTHIFFMGVNSTSPDQFLISHLITEPGGAVTLVSLSSVTAQGSVDIGYTLTAERWYNNLAVGTTFQVVLTCTGQSQVILNGNLGIFGATSYFQAQGFV